MATVGVITRIDDAMRHDTSDPKRFPSLLSWPTVGATQLLWTFVHWIQPATKRTVFEEALSLSPPPITRRITKYTKTPQYCVVLALSVTSIHANTSGRSLTCATSHFASYPIIPSLFYYSRQRDVCGVLIDKIPPFILRLPPLFNLQSCINIWKGKDMFRNFTSSLLTFSLHLVLSSLPLCNFSGPNLSLSSSFKPWLVLIHSFKFLHFFLKILIFQYFLFELRKSSSKLFKFMS